MSFFDRQGILENLIRPHFKASGISTLELFDSSTNRETSESDIGPDFEDDIVMLRDYSFISTSETGTFFTMHRLVQLTTRAWLKSHKQVDQWKEKFISILYQEVPTGQYEHWERCRSLFPHIRSAISQQPKSEDSLLQWATILYRGAWYALESGNIADVRAMASKSKKQRAKLLGGEDDEVLASTAMLAEAYSLEGRWEEAEKLKVQVLETSKSKLGTDHPSTLTSMANLASTLWNQGRWEEVEKLKVQVLETSKSKLGTDHPSTLTSMANLAFTWKSSGRSADAVELLRTCSAKQEQILGPNHPDTLSISGTLLEWETEALNVDA